MSTALDPNEIDPPPKQQNDQVDGEEKEEDEAPEPALPFKEYMGRENLHEIIQKRWGLFFLWTTLVYAYHFVSIIIGMDKYVHYSRFTGCVGTTDFKSASAVFDTMIMLTLIVHIIEWIRQTVMITTILVGVPWILVYNFLTINLPFGIIIFLIAMITGFGAEESCVANQPGRALFLQLQIVSFFLFPFFSLMPFLLCKFCDMVIKPTDKDSKDRLLYTTWTQKQFEAEEEEDDDD